MKNGQLLWKYPSTYQPEDDDDSWALNNAQSAEIYWSPDSKRFALDENNYRFMGVAILGIIVPPATVITHTFYPWDLQLKQPIERYRIRVDKGWLGWNVLSLEITGIYSGSASSAGTPFTQNFICDVAGPRLKILKTK